MMRPTHFVDDYSSRQPATLEASETAQYADCAINMTVRTGQEFWDQWNTSFLYWAFPFSLPAPVGGPDYPNQRRPRRVPTAPTLSPIAHLQTLAKRVESSIRNSWDLIPGLRRITSKWHSVWGQGLWRRWSNNTAQPEEAPRATYVEAAAALYKKLSRGYYKPKEGIRKPIQYDTRKLWFAEGLTAPEKELLQAVRHKQQMLPGTVEVRRRIGQFLFGARVELGEPLFITVSPTMRHNGLVVKFMRYLHSDPAAKDTEHAAFARNQPGVWEAADTTVAFPTYVARRAASARDPWAVDHPSGGILGLAKGLCGAIEYQGNSTPHFHGNLFLANIWQKPLTVLADKLQQEVQEVANVHQFHEWLHSETHPLPEAHAAAVQTQLEDAWRQKFSTANYDSLSQWPRFVVEDTTKSPWLPTPPVSARSAALAEANPTGEKQTHPPLSPEIPHICDEKSHMQDAAAYIAAYKAALQPRFSCQQHHMHVWDPKQKAYQPLAGCCKKDRPNRCKHGFPKKLNPVARVICRGNARRYGLSTKGRKNALGNVLGVRHEPWLSGTARAFTLMMLGNTNTSGNFRVPLTTATHDPTCRRNCLEKNTLQKLQHAMATAARKATKYFTGYMQKPQPLGRKELQQAAKQLTFLNTQQAQEPDTKHFGQVVNRVLGDLEFRCSARPITEEFMLAAFWDPEEPTSAECIRNFPVVPFPGHDFLTHLDHKTDVWQRVKLRSNQSRAYKLGQV